jgi:predicted ATPase/DNA-binding winged helix-turn-helix (wHTH) protein
MTSADTVADAAEEVIRFGPFAMHPAKRLLTQADARVQLGSRAFDILLFLLERAGTFVSKHEIVARVWPTSVVVEGNLRVHVTALRKALGDGRDGRRYIVSVPNRGYSFVAPVSRGLADPPSVVHPAAPRALAPGLVAPLHRIVGRDAAVDSLSRKVLRHRLVTVVGAGGIGKTTVAVSVAAAMTAESAQSPWAGVHFVDLAPLSEGRLVPSALAVALGLTAVADDAMANILAFLHDKSLLLLLDNCEHVASAMTELAEAVLRSAPGIHILATSREPLKADGERIQQLRPLELPATGTSVTAADALRFGAIELFVDCAKATLDTFALEDSEVQSVVDICRRLDGIPLAIELAAACVASLGVRGIEAALESRFQRLCAGRRTAIPRHRTLQAVLDWSYELLSPRERAVLTRISLFRGGFTLESAGAVASDPSLTPANVFDALTDLADKSLLSVDLSDDHASFRLLETTRSYVMNRVAESGEMPALRRRHAEHVLALLQESENAWRNAAAGAWRRQYGRHVDDVRSALDWAMSASGDLGLGIAITLRSALLLFQLSHADECMRFTSAAMDALARSATVDQQLEFELHLVHGLILPHTHGRHPAAQRSFERALAIAQERGDRQQLALAFTTNWVGAYVRGDPRAMLAFAQQFEALTAGETDPATTLLYDWMKAPTLHLLGDQRGARACAERSLAAPPGARASFLSGALIDRHVAMGTILTRVLWLQGLPEQAEEVAARTVERARLDGESVALAYALAYAACPVALWTGRFDVARERISLLLRHALEHSLVSWRNYGLAFESLLAWYESGRVGEPVLRDAVTVDQHITQFAELLATLHPALADDGTFLRGDAGDAGWCQAELLRIRGERARRSDPEAAEALFLRSLERARRDGAVSWGLRAATSLGRLWMERGQERDAITLLRSVLDPLVEGHSTLDVEQATALHDGLARVVVQSRVTPASPSDGAANHRARAGASRVRGPGAT